MHVFSLIDIGFAYLGTYRSTLDFVNGFGGETRARNYVANYYSAVQRTQKGQNAMAWKILNALSNAHSYACLSCEMQTNDVGTTLAGVVVTGKRLNWFKKAWSSFKNYINSFEVEGSIVTSVGVQAGVGFKTPLGSLGVDVNAISVDITSTKDIINGKDDGEFNYAGNGHWMTLRQGAGIDFIFGGVSIEREMKSPTGGGAFFDQKVTEETTIFGYYDKKEYYQGGHQTQSYPTAPTYSNGMKFGFNFQFLLGVKIDFEIKRRK